MTKLQDKTVLIIGGSGGIGGAIAHRFAQEGANVYATSRSAKTEGTTTSVGTGSIRSVSADASQPADLEAAIARIYGDAGRIDILVVNAGLSEFATLDGFTEEHFDRTFGLNVRSLVFAAKGAAGHMGAGGSIVLVGSIAGDIGTKGYGAYGATKAAVRSFARTWANELAPRGIRVNVVSPGPTDTAMFASASDEMRAILTGMIPLGRMGRADEVAAAALFLASAEASFVTGAELPVDGGMAQV
ncbi:SDR family oxidoreductase [Devosia sp. 919]|uniref:SDR family NAD(P)-dependent oxidoreductase n=1 Tax=Devosia sp. 919 TaxID=2726065 RepID=UPI001556C853|nr:SDR family oxidoreductase [Devosia sp. 919]